MKRGLVLVGFIFLLIIISFVSALPDLTVTNITYDGEGSVFYIRFCIKNIGDEFPGPFNLSYSGDLGILETKYFSTFSPDAEESCNSYSSDLNLGVSPPIFEVFIDLENKIIESNESNNIKTLNLSILIDELHLSFSDLDSLNEILITENIAEWTFERSQSDEFEIPKNSGDGCDPSVFVGNVMLHTGDYVHSTIEEATARISVIELSEKIENRGFLEDFIKCALLQGTNLRGKRFEGNNYLYGKVSEYSHLKGEFESDYHIWYIGNKIIMLSYEDVHSVQGEDLLIAYFDKAPSELIAPPGLIEIIINWFRKLFGGE